MYLASKGYECLILFFPSWTVIESPEKTGGSHSPLAIGLLLLSEVLVVALGE